MVTKDIVAALSGPLILRTLSQGESYGCEIVQRVRELTDGELEWTDGMLYPVPRRLEADDLIVSEWRVSDAGRRRRYYQINADGSEALATERAVASRARDAAEGVGSSMSECRAPSEEQIAVWRCSLLEHDEILREEVDELEAHVREAAAQRVEGGACEEQSVADAIAAVGAPWVVALEHAKADPGRVWRRRAQWMLAGPLAALLVMAPLTLLGTAVFATLVTAGVYYRTAAGWRGNAVSGPLGVACMLTWQICRGRGPLLVAWVDARTARVRKAMQESFKAKCLFVATFAAAAVTWAAPMALWHLPWPYGTYWSFNHYAFVTADTALFAAASIALAQWSHCRRSAISRLRIADRELAMVWARRVRWMAIGLAVHITTQLVAEALGDVAATLIWDGYGSFDQIIAAVLGVHVVGVGLLATSVLWLALPCRDPRLRAVNRVACWWRHAPNSLTTAVAALLLVTTVALLNLLNIPTDLYPALRGYEGLNAAMGLCRAAGHGLQLAAFAVVFTLIIRRGTPCAPSSARELWT